MSGSIELLRKQMKEKQTSNILLIQPGRELDALVAEYVFGYSVLYIEEGELNDYWYRLPSAGRIRDHEELERVPNFSTVLFSAGQLIALFPYWTVQNGSEPGLVDAAFGSQQPLTAWVRGCASLPEALSKASLLALLDQNKLLDKLLAD